MESGTRREADEGPGTKVSAPTPALAGARRKPIAPREPIFEVSGLTVSYGDVPAIRDIDLEIGRNRITALIGPSGCGKSTMIRCFNRMNDLIPAANVAGSIIYHGQDLYGADVDPVEVRKLIGMVFQKPNPFPKSIYDNVAFGPRVIGMKRHMDGIVEQRAAARCALGRGQGPAQGQRLLASPADSSSASALRAVWRWSRT